MSLKVSENEALRATTRNVSFEDALGIGERCFGELGRRTIFLWRQYNDAYFGGALRVTPVLFVPTSPFGHWVGLCCYGQNIYLMFPNKKRPWSYVRGVLLHEMTHEALNQQGKDAAHAGTPWCQEIMRITRLLGAPPIWAGRYLVKRVDGRPQRVNEAEPSPSGARVLKQKEIARWPHSIGIEPPELVTRS